MRLVAFSSFILISIAWSEALENLMGSGSDIQKCINCLCHARSGCYNRFNCARYSISRQYWEQAGSPRLNPEDDPDSESTFTSCMKNENCILNTVQAYTESFGKIDCNCDGVFDCKDRFAIHLFSGDDCINPKFGRNYATRFNHCAREIGVKAMVEEEGNADCEPEIV